MASGVFTVAPAACPDQMFTLDCTSSLKKLQEQDTPDSEQRGGYPCQALTPHLAKQRKWF